MRGVTGLDGARGKKQVWCPHDRTWRLSEANTLYWNKHLWHCCDFSAPPQWFGTLIVIQHPENCAPCTPSLHPCTQCFFNIWMKSVGGRPKPEITSFRAIDWSLLPKERKDKSLNGHGSIPPNFLVRGSIYRWVCKYLLNHSSNFYQHHCFKRSLVFITHLSAMFPSTNDPIKTPARYTDVARELR